MEYEQTLMIVMIMGFLGFFANKIIEKRAEFDWNQYKLQRKKISQGTKSKKKDDEDLDDVDDFEDSLPPWLSAVFEGAGVDINKFYDGDEKEIEKLKKIVDKLPQMNNKLIG